MEWCSFGIYVDHVERIEFRIFSAFLCHSLTRDDNEKLFWTLRLTSALGHRLWNDYFKFPQSTWKHCKKHWKIDRLANYCVQQEKAKESSKEIRSKHRKTMRPIWPTVLQIPIRDRAAINTTLILIFRRCEFWNLWWPTLFALYAH